MYQIRLLMLFRFVARVATSEFNRAVRRVYESQSCQHVFVGSFTIIFPNASEDCLQLIRWSRVKFCFKNRLACLENKQKWKKDKNELNWKMLKMGISINSLINALAYWMCYTPLVLESKDLWHISVVRAVR